MSWPTAACHRCPRGWSRTVEPRPVHDAVVMGGGGNCVPASVRWNRTWSTCTLLRRRLRQAPVRVVRNGRVRSGLPAPRLVRPAVPARVVRARCALDRTRRRPPHPPADRERPRRAHASGVLGVRTQGTPVGVAVDLERFRAPTKDERAAARALLGLGQERVALVLARLTRQKGQDQLVPVWRDRRSPGRCSPLWGQVSPRRWQRLREASGVGRSCGSGSTPTCSPGCGRPTRWCSAPGTRDCPRGCRGHGDRAPGGLHRRRRCRRASSRWGPTGGGMRGAVGSDAGTDEGARSGWRTRPCCGARLSPARCVRSGCSRRGLSPGGSSRLTRTRSVAGVSDHDRQRADVRRSGRRPIRNHWAGGRVAHPPSSLRHRPQGTALLRVAPGRRTFHAPGDEHTINKVAITDREAYLGLYPRQHRLPRAR